MLLDGIMAQSSVTGLGGGHGWLWQRGLRSLGVCGSCTSRLWTQHSFLWTGTPQSFQRGNALGLWIPYSPFLKECEAKWLGRPVRELDMVCCHLVETGGSGVGSHAQYSYFILQENSLTLCHSLQDGDYIDWRLVLQGMRKQVVYKPTASVSLL